MKTYSTKISETDLKTLKDLLTKTEGLNQQEQFSNLLKKMCERESERVFFREPSLTSSPLLLSPQHDCIFLSPFVKEPENIICMKAWKTKDKIVKVPKETCQFCFDKGFIIEGSIPKPKTELESLEEKQRLDQQKRKEYDRATTRTGIFHEDFVKKRKGEDDPFREPLSGKPFS